MEVRAQKHKSRPDGLSLENRVLSPWTPFRMQDYLLHIVVSFIFSHIVLMQKKKKKKEKLCQKLIDSAYVNTLNTLVINNASELRKESMAFPSEVI